MDKNVLITSVGGLTGVFLSKHLKKYSNVNIIGIDMSETVASKQWIDSFFVVPPSQSQEYMDKVIDIVEKESVNVIIPVSSYDMNAFSEEEAFPKEIREKLLIMDGRIHKLLHNKETCYGYLSRQGISTPVIYEKEATSYPCILKPKEGTGSKNTVVIENDKDLLYWSYKVKEYILTEYLEGNEYTVDCLFDKKGYSVGYNVRQRSKVSGGGAVICKNTTQYDERVERIIEILERTGVLKGPVNFQFKEKKNGELCVFDFNTRFASGGLPLTVAAGFDIPYLMIKMIVGENIEPVPRRDMDNELTMIRYYEEAFVHE